MFEWSRAKFCDVVNLFLGTILFFSPWLFSLSLGTPRQTAAIAGLLIAVLSIAALTAFAVWEEWLNLIAGLSVVASPRRARASELAPVDALDRHGQFVPLGQRLEGACVH
jgi:hypothetical protein